MNSAEVEAVKAAIPCGEEGDRIDVNRELIARAAIAALDAIRGDGWMPIESLSNDIEDALCCYTDGQGKRRVMQVGDWPNVRDGVAYITQWHSGPLGVTHWRPLPAPPALPSLQETTS